VSSDSETRLNDGDYVVGRDLKAEIRVHDLAVSRRHARITVTGETITIEDLGSKNGTWVGEQRVEGQAQLQDGVMVRFGSAAMTLRRESERTVTVAGLNESRHATAGETTDGEGER
jgi:pSer/pThr/pTyr-binding forkhead associated (FHA) protein